MFWKRQKPRQSDHELTNPLLQSLLAMAWFVEARDPYTAGHLWRGWSKERSAATTKDRTEKATPKGCHAKR